MKAGRKVFSSFYQVNTGYTKLHHLVGVNSCATTKLLNADDKLWLWLKVGGQQYLTRSHFRLLQYLISKHSKNIFNLLSATVAAAL